MKRSISIFLAILILLSLTACKESGNDKGASAKPTKFNEKEIESAIKKVTDNFSFPGAELKRVRYEESKSEEAIKPFMENGKGKDMDIDPNNVIVIFTDFDITGDNPTLSKGEYKDYNWILVRADKDSEWKIEDQGY